MVKVRSESEWSRSEWSGGGGGASLAQLVTGPMQEVRAQAAQKSAYHTWP